MTRLRRWFTRVLYEVGFRPKKTSRFYSHILETQAQWRTGKP